ncbi:MAG: heat-inducible transcription repressor HrcA [Synergistales bacterium]|nr:heat-inducible transcription repressor HrcA [Synergistales bacterium]
MLTERQLEIVLSVVYEYIETGEPSGSRTISKKYLRGCSPATVRNEMADLEEMGYLYQPHTSAGRIPTPKAYRLYVDSIMQRKRLPHPVFRDWLSEMRSQRQDLETVMSYTSHLLGRMTSYIGVAAIANLEEVILQRVDFLRLGGETVLMVMILDGGIIHSRTVNISADVHQDLLDDLARTINSIASGKVWGKTKDILYTFLLKELEKLFNACRDAIAQMDMILSSSNYRLFTGGASHILSLPDFQDIGKLKAILSILEEEQVLVDLVERCSLEDGVRVTIGDENNSTGMNNCSIVTVSKRARGQKAVLGLIGPMRMDYERSISLLETLLKGLYK